MISHQDPAWLGSGLDSSQVPGTVHLLLVYSPAMDKQIIQDEGEGGGKWSALLDQVDEDHGCGE